MGSPGVKGEKVHLLHFMNTDLSLFFLVFSLIISPQHILTLNRYHHIVMIDLSSSESESIAPNVIPECTSLYKQLVLVNLLLIIQSRRQPPVNT